MVSDLLERCRKAALAHGHRGWMAPGQETPAAARRRDICLACEQLKDDCCQLIPGCAALNLVPWRFPDNECPLKKWGGMERVVHQIWIGPYRTPEKERAYGAAVEQSAKAAGWEYRLWQNADVPELPMAYRELWEQFDRQQDYAHQADILRVWLVAEHGGLYLDLDHAVLPGAAPLLRRLEAAAGMFCGHWGDDYTIPNGSFGLAHGHPIAEYLRNAVRMPQAWYGPSWMGDTVHQFYGMERVIDHNTLSRRLLDDGVIYLHYGELSQAFRHDASYSWSPENKRRMAQEVAQ